jgi:hypothetical protein
MDKEMDLTGKCLLADCTSSCILAATLIHASAKPTQDTQEHAGHTMLSSGGKRSRTILSLSCFLAQC